MKNKYLKKWKKAHRQKRKSRMVVSNIELNIDTIKKLKEYCKKRNISFKTGIHKCLREAMVYYSYIIEDNK